MRFTDLERYTFSELQNMKWSDMELLFAIFDRELLDVQRVKYLKNKINLTGWVSLTSNEKTEWLNELKGAFNYKDMNRIENNLQIYSDIFNLGFTQKFDWNIGDFPTVVDFERIHTNVGLIKSSPYGKVNSSSNPQLPINSYSKINTVEKIIYDSFKNQYENELAKPYCGEFYCGEYGLV